ncbi:efflux RND transporter permease subunit [Niastella vici]|uniref:efflux RND transporter permease subunit n=1 Tax=Niastella vici TaxID=1703345 RepID=UPI00117D84F4|nr:efflux RND transporter permease subunit [Niastella vici]
MNHSSKRIKLPLPPFTIITLFAALMIAGVAFVPLLSFQLEPSPDVNNITVSFSWQGASAELLEQEVTSKIEGVLSTVKGVKNIRSVSSNGYGFVQTALDEGVNINQVRFEIAMLMRQVYAGFPGGVSYPMVSANQPSRNGTKSILSYVINGPGSASAIQQLAEKSIKPKLVQIKGVYEINIYGAPPLGWELSYDPHELERCHVSINDIRSCIGNYFREYELGKAYDVPLTRPSRSSYSYLTLKTNGSRQIDLAKIPVKKIGNRNIYLSDLVKMSYKEQDAYSYYRINGFNTVNIEIVADKNTNYLTLSKTIKEQIQNIQQHLPPQHAIMLAYDATDYLQKELNKITWRTVATLIILLLFVLLVSKQIRYLLLITISLISNLLLSCILYYFFKLKLHLFSLAGITVSMGMIIDNSIVVIEHIRYRKNMRVLLAVAGATLCTIGAVCIVFFLDKEQQMKLIDFACIMIINLGVSLLIALLFIPALMNWLPLKVHALSKQIRRKKRVVHWNRFYLRLITFCSRFRILLVPVIILLFGIPVFMLPEKIESDSRWANTYNATIGSEFYNKSLRSWVDKGLGGTLRLFLTDAEQFSYDDIPLERTCLKVTIHMPKGANLEQMNDLVVEWESYLSGFNEVAQYQSRVYNGQYADIEILFKKQFEESSFPITLKNQLETKAAFTGLAEFNITGVGIGFNNELHTETTNYGLELNGYNYDRLRELAEQVKTLLKANPRVEKISITSTEDQKGERSNYEYVFRVHSQDKLLLHYLSPHMISNALTTLSGEKRRISDVLYHGNYVPVILSPVNKTADIWEVMNGAVRSDSGTYVRLKEFADMEKEKEGDQILRENKQYQLVVNYNFIGDLNLGEIVSERIIKQVSADLPLGYSLKETKHNFWRGAKKKLTWAILLTIGIVFVICSVLLNDCKQPLAIIAMIPISFIGVFLSAYFFRYKFDEGGYAGMIMLCGVVVNAALFILNDYNNLLRDYPAVPRRRLYIKAYNSKIVPVMLSITSMTLGLTPFIVYSKDETFWYPLAMTVTGGLLFSVIAILIFLPLFLKRTCKK